MVVSSLVWEMSVVSSKCTFSESYIIPCQVQGVSDASKCPWQNQFLKRRTHCLKRTRQSFKEGKKTWGGSLPFQVRCDCYMRIVLLVTIDWLGVYPMPPEGLTSTNLAWNSMLFQVGEVGGGGGGHWFNQGHSKDPKTFFLKYVYW